MEAILNFLELYNYKMKPPPPPPASMSVPPDQPLVAQRLFQALSQQGQLKEREGDEKGLVDPACHLPAFFFIPPTDKEPGTAYHWQSVLLLKISRGYEVRHYSLKLKGTGRHGHGSPFSLLSHTTLVLLLLYSASA